MTFTNTYIVQQFLVLHTVASELSMDVNNSCTRGVHTHNYYIIVCTSTLLRQVRYIRDSISSIFEKKGLSLMGCSTYMYMYKAVASRCLSPASRPAAYVRTYVRYTHTAVGVCTSMP